MAYSVMFIEISFNLAIYVGVKLALLVDYKKVQHCV